jgi:hypothetical protein
MWSKTEYEDRARDRNGRSRTISWPVPPIAWSRLTGVAADLKFHFPAAMPTRTYPVFPWSPRKRPGVTGTGVKFFLSISHKLRR